MEATLDNCGETGSDPHGMARISIKLKIAARLAQSVEHETLKVYMERQNTHTSQHDIEEQQQVGILTPPDLATVIKTMQDQHKDNARSYK